MCLCVQQDQAISTRITRTFSPEGILTFSLVAECCCSVLEQKNLVWHSGLLHAPLLLYSHSHKHSKRELGPAGYRPCSPWPRSQGNSKGRLTKSLSEQARGLKTHVSLEACPPPPSFMAPCPGFSPPDPSPDPFVGEKQSRSLEAANYRVLTSAWLSPKC